MLGSFIRHLNRKSYNVSLLDDVRFSSMRESLKSKQKQLKKMGKGNRPMRAEPLTHTELDKLYESQQLGLSTPSSLLHTLWFNNCTHFGLRGGKQEHRGLCWGDVTLKRDSDGREYLELRERQTKTRTGEDIRNVREVAPRAWENGENPEQCPVAAYKLFRSKRPKKYCGAEDPFYIAPIPTNPFPSSSERWFISQPVGVNKLCSIMSNMCRAAGVSEDKRLTNHSARKFLVQTLTGARIADRDIMQVTGHKNVQSIRNYSQITEEDHRGISNLLCGNRSKPSAAANFPVASTSRAGAQRPSDSASQQSQLQTQQPQLQTQRSQLQTQQSQLPTLQSQLPTQQSQLRNQLPGQNVMQTVNAAAHSTAGKMFTNCKIGTVIINNYFTTTTTRAGMSPPRKRARCIIVSDSDSSQNSQWHHKELPKFHLCKYVCWFGVKKLNIGVLITSVVIDCGRFGRSLSYGSSRNRLKKKHCYWPKYQNISPLLHWPTYVIWTFMTRASGRTSKGMTFSHICCIMNNILVLFCPFCGSLRRVSWNYFFARVIAHHSVEVTGLSAVT